MTDTAPLTEQELTVFRCIAEGLTPVEIGELLLMPEDTVYLHLFDVRQKLGAKTNTHAVLLAVWHYPKLLAGAVARHGTLKAIDWHEDNGIPLCPECSRFDGVVPQERKPSAPYRRLTSSEERVARGQVILCGSIQKARQHIAQGERIGDLVCGCREAYVLWWREYRKERATPAPLAG